MSIWISVGGIFSLISNQNFIRERNQMWRSNNEPDFIRLLSARVFPKRLKFPRVSHDSWTAQICTHLHTFHSHKLQVPFLQIKKSSTIKFRIMKIPKLLPLSLNGVESWVQRICVSTSIMHNQVVSGLHFGKRSSFGNIITLKSLRIFSVLLSNLEAQGTADILLNFLSLFRISLRIQNRYPWHA